MNKSVFPIILCFLFFNPLIWSQEEKSLWDKLIENPAKTSCFHFNEERQLLENQIQKEADKLDDKTFTTWLKADTVTARQLENKYPILFYLNNSFDKILKEIKETMVSENEVVFWHVYNMGYIVKTKESLFGIDVFHRRAAELADKLDFLLVTHRHGDHYWPPLFEAMDKLNKPIVSNFHPSPYCKKEPAFFSFGSITIQTNIVDHNDKLKKYVTTYKIDCGPSSGHFIIYHTGDACRNQQIVPEGNIDLFIPHVSVGLKIPQAVDVEVKPRYTFMAHLLELGHPVNKWRWPLSLGHQIGAQCHHGTCLVPVWGEKIVHSKDK